MPQKTQMHEAYRLHSEAKPDTAVQTLPYLKIKQSLIKLIHKLKDDKPDLMFRAAIDKNRKKYVHNCLLIIHAEATDKEELANSILFFLKQLPSLCYSLEYGYYREKLRGFLIENKIMPKNEHEAMHQYIHSEHAEMIYNSCRDAWPKLPDWSAEPTNMPTASSSTCPIS